MPEISRFFGLVIMMYFSDHAPPHFHVRYGGRYATVSIDPLGVLRGDLSPRALGLVLEWASLHKTALLDNWHLAQSAQPLKEIPPLE